MENNKSEFDYYRLKFNVYKVEVGVFLDEDNVEYNYYNEVYDKKHSYYEENVVFELDYLQAIEYAKSYVNNGVNGTYAIVSKLKYDMPKLDIKYVMEDINNILGGGFVEDYIGIFGSKNIYGVDNVIYSLYKVRDEKHPYTLGKGNGDIIENFINKNSQ